MYLLASPLLVIHQALAFPSGLSLNSSTGTISGTPSSTVSSRTVTIKVYSSSTNYVYRELSFTVFENASSCSSNKILVTISRTTTTYAGEERFKVLKYMKEALLELLYLPSLL